MTACCGRRRACCRPRPWRSSALPSGRAGPARFSAICARIRLSRPNPSGQSAAADGLRRALFPVAARHRRAGRSCHGDRAGRERCRRADRRGSRRRQIGDDLCVGGRRRRERTVARARRMAQKFSRHQQVARQRPELHGLLQLPRKTVRLSQHRIVQRSARPGRRHFPVRRHDAVLAKKRRRPRPALFLCGVVGQRGRSRSRRLSRFHGRRSAHQTDRAVHRRHPAAASFHARRRARASQAGKPVLAIKTGATQKSRAAARSHTGAIGGDYAAYLAMCERYGIVNCRSLDDLVGMHAGLPVRPVAERPAHRLRHHLGRHGRSALRLCRDRRRRGARIQRRHQRGADAAYAGRHCAEKPARYRHSVDAQGGGRPVRHRGARSEGIDIVAWASPLPGKGGVWDDVARTSPPAERDRQAGARRSAA